MFAVIHIPQFFLQAALRPAPDLHAKPVALVDGSATKPVVIQMTQAAREQGVVEGMSPTQALARCPELLIKTRSPAQEAAAAKALLDCAAGFSPYIEATAEGTCTIDMKGNPLLREEEAPELFRDAPGGGESAPTPRWRSWADKILSRLLELHLASQIGMARTPLLAWHAARHAAPVRIVHEPSSFLAELPIESLEPSPQTLAILKKWGIDTVGALTALGKSEVAERLGAEALSLFERATADSLRPLRLENPPECFEEAIDFETEIETAQPLLFVLRRFLDQIALRLETVYLVASEIHLRLLFSKGPDHERSFKVPAPTRNVANLFRILDTYLETLRTEVAIIGLRLAVTAARPSHQQFSLFESALRDPNQFYETLARLTGLVGSERVGVPEVLDTHRPDSFRLQPVSFDWLAASSRKDEPAALPQRRGGGRPATARSAEAHGLALRRFRPPLPAEVQLKGDIPAALRTAIFSCAITIAKGPWRSSGDWWDEQSWKREEWDVETPQGELYRLCHERNQWFVEAVYD